MTLVQRLYLTQVDIVGLVGFILMQRVALLLVLCVFSLAVPSVANVDCTNIKAGSYVYNLHSLMGKPFTQQTTSQQVYQYSWRVCGQLPEPCHNFNGVAACQAWGTFVSQNSMKNCGLYQGFKASGLPNGKGVTITYQNGEGGRVSYVVITCSESESTDNWQAVNAPGTLVYNFTIAHKAGCGKKVSSSGASEKSGISGGSIFLILFFCGGALYFIVGAVVNKFVRHEEGIKIIPNVDFWISLPGLIKDGVLFVVNKVRGLFCSGSYQPVAG